MKRLLSIVFGLIVCSVAFAQVKVYGDSYEQALEQARQENKLLLINCTSPGG